MSDCLTIQDGKVTLTTEEGQTLERPESDLRKMIQKEVLPPLNGAALPDGIKFSKWQPPAMVLVHQMPPHVRQLRGIVSSGGKYWILGRGEAAKAPEALLVAVPVDTTIFAADIAAFSCAAEQLPGYGATPFEALLQGPSRADRCPRRPRLWLMPDGARRFPASRPSRTRRLQAFGRVACLWRKPPRRRAHSTFEGPGQG